MAAGVKTDQSQWTRFPNGIAILDFYAVPGAAGNLVCTGILLAKDTLIQVVCATHTAGVVSASADYVNEFTISADDQINNTGGTSNANKIVHVRVARSL